MKIKSIFLLLFGFIILLIGLVLLFEIYILKNQTHLYDSQVNRYRSYLLGEQLRRANTNLTKYCVRYVLTGDNTWEKMYREVLELRQGQIPNPMNGE